MQSEYHISIANPNPEDHLRAIAMVYSRAPNLIYLSLKNKIINLLTAHPNLVTFGIDDQDNAI